MARFQPKLFVALLTGFISFTIVGTLLHETGHYLVAKYYGFDASVHYGHTSFDQMPVAFRRDNDSIQAWQIKYHLVHQIDDRYVVVDTVAFPQKQRYQALVKKQQQILLPIHLGGPAQTMLTGTLGVGLLLINRRWWQQKPQLRVGVWLVVFMALFWLRQLFNLVMATFTVLRQGQWSARLDEVLIARNLHLWPASISLVTGLVGLGVLSFITLRVIPASQRPTFIGAGLLGGTFGFWLWLVWLGPKLLP